MAETFPQFWIMKPCRYWTADKNKRFRLIRLDGPTDVCGSYPSHQYDAQTGRWSRTYSGTKGGELARRARANEIPGELFNDLPEKRRDPIAWQRFPGICRAEHLLWFNGKSTGFWVRAAQHPTALRPYYVQKPDGYVLSKRKYSKLVEAKAAAIAAYDKSKGKS